MNDSSVFQILIMLLQIYSWIVIIRVLLSWFQPNPYNQFYMLLINLTEPILSRIRNILPRTSFGAFDFSPIILILVINLLINLIHRFH